MNYKNEHMLNYLYWSDFSKSTSNNENLKIIESKPIYLFILIFKLYTTFYIEFYINFLKKTNSFLIYNNYRIFKAFLILYWWVYSLMIFIFSYFY